MSMKRWAHPPSNDILCRRRLESPRARTIFVYVCVRSGAGVVPLPLLRLLQENLREMLRMSQIYMLLVCEGSKGSLERTRASTRCLQSASYLRKAEFGFASARVLVGATRLQREVDDRVNGVMV